eukprot:1804676-Amphidinium_carterae.1
MLLQATKARALSLVMAAEEGNGYLAWRALMKEYKPSLASRHNAMLVAVLSPKFVDSKPFSEQMVEWRRLVEQYKRASGKDVDNSMKVAILTQHAPGKMRQVVVQAAARCGNDYVKFEKELWDYEAGSRTFTAHGAFAGSSLQEVPVPMEIGSIGAAACQYCGRKGHDAKSCWQVQKLKGGKGKERVLATLRAREENRQ